MSEIKPKYVTKRNNEEHPAYQASDAEMLLHAPTIRQLLAHHVGREQAINADTIAARIGITGKNANRRVRSIIARMVDEHGDFIGSSPHAPTGYWMIKDRDEVKSVLINWRNRSLAIMRRYKRLSDMAYRTYGIPVEQLKLEM